MRPEPPAPASSGDPSRPGASERPSIALAVPPGPAGIDVLMPALTAALGGAGPAVAILPDSGPPEYRARIRAAVQPGAPVPTGVAVVLATSGSTGDPAGVLLPGAALHAAAAAFERVCAPGGARTRSAGRSGSSRGAPADPAGNAAGPAAETASGHRWVAALALHHAGGLMVAARSVVAGTTPIAVASLGGAQPFSVAAFAAATEEARALSAADGRPLAVSLVPPMLALLDEAGRSGLDLLRGYNVVLVGGAAIDRALADRIGSAGVRLRRSYGMTETCGGAVFDGRALPGVTVRADAAGHLVICGAQVAAGYRDGRDAGRWTAGPQGHGCFQTSDRGRIDADGVVTVTGRADDVVQVGGASVSLAAVRVALLAEDGVADAEVVAVHDERFGATIAAFVVPARHPREGDAAEDLSTGTLEADAVAERLADGVARVLGRAARPRLMQAIDEIPLLAAGKPDRAAMVERATRALAGPGRPGRRDVPVAHDRIPQ